MSLSLEALVCWSLRQSLRQYLLRLSKKASGHMVTTENENVGFEDKQIIALCDAIRREFPKATYTGKVTRHDNAWLPKLTEENAIHDDDMFLYEGLTNGKEMD